MFAWGRANVKQINLAGVFEEAGRSKPDPTR